MQHVNAEKRVAFFCFLIDEFIESIFISGYILFRRCLIFQTVHLLILFVIF